MHSFLRLLPLAAVLSGSPLLLHAQEAPAPASGWQKAIGLSFTPTRCYRTLRNNGGGNRFGLDQKIGERDGQERSDNHFDVGAALRLMRGPNLRLEAGLSFARRGYQSRVPILSPNPAVPRYEDTKYRYQFLSVPLQVSRTFGQGRLQGFVGGGLSVDFLLKMRAETTYHYVDGRQERREESVTQDLLWGTVTPRLTAGLRYALTPQYSLELAPVLQYSLLMSRRKQEVQEYLYSTGVSVGVYRVL